MIKMMTIIIIIKYMNYYTYFIYGRILILLGYFFSLSAVIKKEETTKNASIAVSHYRCQNKS